MFAFLSFFWSRFGKKLWGVCGGEIGGGGQPDQVFKYLRNSKVIDREIPPPPSLLQLYVAAEVTVMNIFRSDPAGI